MSLARTVAGAPGRTETNSTERTPAGARGFDTAKRTG